MKQGDELPELANLASMAGLLIEGLTPPNVQHIVFLVNAEGVYMASLMSLPIVIRVLQDFLARVKVQEVKNNVPH